MMEFLTAFVSGFYQVFAPSTFVLMCIGLVIGFVVGILPGLGGPTAMALMLPFIFKMSAVEAFAFLLGMTAVTATTGDITSVLFGVPGEPTTASTIIDGHAMAKKGEAGRALGAVLMSSLVGAIFGAVCIVPYRDERLGDDRPGAALDRAHEEHTLERADSRTIWTS